MSVISVLASCTLNSKPWGREATRPMRPERIICVFLRSTQAKVGGPCRPVVECWQPDLVANGKNYQQSIQNKHIPFKRKLLIFYCQTTTLSEITAGILKGRWGWWWQWRWWLGVAEAVISGVQLHWSASVYQQCLWLGNTSPDEPMKWTEEALRREWKQR